MFDYKIKELMYQRYINQLNQFNQSFHVGCKRHCSQMKSKYLHMITLKCVIIIRILFFGY